MKYIKLFEFKGKSEYWLIPADYRMNAALRKIPNMTEDYIEVLNRPTVEVRNSDYIYVAHSPNNKHFNFGWMPYVGMIPCGFYEGMGYEYKGMIGISDDEFEMRDNMEKYNL